MLAIIKAVQAKQNPTLIRSPLRYPGGKTRAISAMYPFLPHNLKKMCAPFLGGASFELACANKGISVYGSDAFEPLINFWTYAKNEPMILAKTVGKYHPLSKSKFYTLQENYDDLPNNLQKAAVFFVLNRSSYSGSTFSGGMSPNHPRFNQNAIDRLRDFRADNIFIEHCDYKKALQKHNDTFLYLDPPYANGEKLYGNNGDMHEDFNHEDLAELLTKRDGWILSYNDCPRIRKLYAKYKMVEPQWTYGMSREKKSSELLIVNA